MTKRIMKVVAVAVVFASAALCVYRWHKGEMSLLSQQLREEQERRERLSMRVQDIREKLDSSESENASLLERIDDMLTEEEAVFDSESLMEEIREIGELAAVEYHFTNVGTLDAADRFKVTNWEKPFSRKTAVVTMDGVIKAGIDVKEVRIDVDEAAKTIFVSLPEAAVLSNELFEDSLAVYVEEESLFSNLTLEDSSTLRDEIRSSAEKNALDSGLLTQAHDRAGELVRHLIEAVPSVRDAYSIVIR